MSQLKYLPIERKKLKNQKLLTRRSFMITLTQVAKMLAQYPKTCVISVLIVIGLGFLYTEWK